MSDHKDSSAAATMDTNSERERKDKDSLGEMINSAAMSILDGEDFTMGPVQVKWVLIILIRVFSRVVFKAHKIGATTSWTLLRFIDKILNRIKCQIFVLIHLPTNHFVSLKLGTLLSPGYHQRFREMVFMFNCSFLMISSIPTQGGRKWTCKCTSRALQSILTSVLIQTQKYISIALPIWY